MSLLLILCLVYYTRFILRRIRDRQKTESTGVESASQRAFQDPVIRRRVIAHSDRRAVMDMLILNKSWFADIVPVLYSSIPIQLVDSIRPPLFGLSFLWRLLLSSEGRRRQYSRAVTEILFGPTGVAERRTWSPLYSKDPASPSIFLLAMYFPKLRRVFYEASNEDLGVRRSEDTPAVGIHLEEGGRQQCSSSTPLVRQRSWEICVSRSGPKTTPGLVINWEIRIRTMSQLQEDVFRHRAPLGWPLGWWVYHYTLVVNIGSTSLQHKARIRQWIVETVGGRGEIHALQMYSLDLTNDDLGAIAETRRKSGKKLDRLVLGYPTGYNPRAYDALIESVGALHLTDLAIDLYVSPQDALQHIFAPIQRHCQGLKRLAVVCHRRKTSRATSDDKFPIYWQSSCGSIEEVYYRSTLRGASASSHAQEQEAAAAAALQVLWAIAGVVQSNAIVRIEDSKSGMDVARTSCPSLSLVLACCRR